MATPKLSSIYSYGSTDVSRPPLAAVSIAADAQALRWSKRLHIQRHLRLIARLAHMGPAEFWQRASKALVKRLGLMPTAANNYRETKSSQSDGLARRLGPGFRENLSAHFDRAFFFGPTQRSAMVKSMQGHVPDAKSRVAGLAGAIGGDGLRYLGCKVPIVAGQLDWQADPQSGSRAWTTGILDEIEAIEASTADVKYVWEVNRHQFLPILGRAYWLTGDERYAHQAVALIDDWIAKNPVGLGVNWCSHLEVAMRAISWLWTMPFLLALPGLSKTFLARWVESIASHYYHLRRNLSIYTDPTNHLIGEATALWMLCICFPALPGAAKEQQRALLILTREVERQIASDGVNKEQATSYHRFVLDFFLQVLVLAQRNGIRLSPTISRQIASMIEFVAALAGDHGTAPMIGDSDDARGLPFLELVGWNFKDTLSTGAVLFQRGDWKQTAGPIAEVSVWLLGPNAIDRYERLPCVDKPKSISAFPDGGYYFLKNNDRFGRAELIFDAGPLGLWPNAAHGHADALSILIRLNGKLLLTDPGTGTYFGSKRQRDYFRSTAAHNTITVDDLDQADLFDTFKWVNPMNVKVHESQTVDGFSYVSGMHDGYQRLRAGVSHQRSVLATESNGWVIVDQVSGKGKHSIKRHFNFHPGTELVELGNQSILAWDPITGNGLRFDFPVVTRSSALHHIDTAQIGLWSGQYGDIQTAPHLTVETVDTLELTLFTFITPIFHTVETEVATAACKLEIHAIEDHRAYVCRRSSGSLTDRIDEVILVNPLGRGVMMPSEHHCNALFAYMQLNRDGQAQRAFLIGEGASIISSKFQLRCEGQERSTGYTRTAR